MHDGSSIKLLTGALRFLLFSITPVVSVASKRGFKRLTSSLPHFSYSTTLLDCLVCSFDARRTGNSHPELAREVAQR
jgi:hypothetical protein